MLKISSGTSASGLHTLRLEGRVVGPWVGELQRLCEQLVDERRSLILDVAEVIFADERGLALLASLRRRRVELMNLPPFLEAQLQANCAG